MHEECVTRHAGCGVLMMVLKIVKTSHYMELEINEN